jgi:hypothetical protein
MGKEKDSHLLISSLRDNCFDIRFFSFTLPGRLLNNKLLQRGRAHYVQIPHAGCRSVVDDIGIAGWYGSG